MDNIGKGKEQAIPPYTRTSWTMWPTNLSIEWYVVAMAMFLWYVWPYIRGKYENWKRRKEEEEYNVKYQNNTELQRQRFSALEASRQKMQEDYCKKSTLTKQMPKSKERKKDSWQSMTVNCDTEESNEEAKSKAVKREYYPLMGDGSRGYKPRKHTRCGKGGCG